MFDDYEKTGLIYHVASIIDLKKILSQGIKYDDKETYQNKYLAFHKYIDKFKPSYIPKWVIRENAIFCSLNFPENHNWHSHSALLGVKINPDRCWVANENLANYIYEPFILKNIPLFFEAKKYIKVEGEKYINRYWNTSLSFDENLMKKKDKERGYDLEVMVFDDIKPKDIKVISIFSDHKVMNLNEWKNFFNSC